MSKRTLVAVLAAVFLAITVVACGGTQVAPTRTGGTGPKPTIVRTPTPVAATPDEAVRQIINAECEAVVQQDIDRLQGIWAPDGVIIDANHSPDNTGDDVTWKGWEAVRDRYVNLVFPSSPTFCEHPGINVSIGADNVSATASTGVNIGNTKCTDCNKWTFKKVGDAWKIVTLTYNLNPQK